MRCVRVTVGASLSRELLKDQKIARQARSYRVRFRLCEQYCAEGGFFCGALEVSSKTDLYLPQHLWTPNTRKVAATKKVRALLIVAIFSHLLINFLHHVLMQRDADLY